MRFSDPLLSEAVACNRLVPTAELEVAVVLLREAGTGVEDAAFGRMD